MSAPAPIHPLADVEVPPGSRLLLLSYHFPPGQAAGARRWEKIVHFAKARGLGVDVFTLAPEDLPSADFDRLAGLPEGTRVFGIPSVRSPLGRVIDLAARGLRALRRRRPAPSAAAPSAGTPSSPSASTWVKRVETSWSLTSPGGLSRATQAALEFYDGASWARAAARQATAIHRSGQHVAIVSCGPPHMVHRAGAQLSKELGLPLIADLRDPWSLAERVHISVGSRLWFHLAERFESRAFEQASVIAMNTPSAAAAVRDRYPALADRIISVTNGFDRDPTPPPDQGATFVVAYAGSIYVDRSPRNLFRAVRQVATSLDLSGEDLQVELMGHRGLIDGQTIEEMIIDEQVDDFVTLHPAGTERDVAALLSRAAVLLNLPQDSHLAIPSKIYEYMVYPAWLLALAERGSATAEILSGTAADVVDPADVEGIAAMLTRCLLDYRAGKRPTPVARDETLSRAHQAGLLLDALEHSISGGLEPRSLLRNGPRSADVG